MKKNLLIILAISFFVSSCSGDYKMPTLADTVKSQQKALESIGTNYEKGKAMLDNGNKMIEEGNKKILQGQKLINEGTQIATEGKVKAEEGKNLMYNSTESYNNTIMSSPVYLYQGSAPIPGAPGNSPYPSAPSPTGRY
ncbi:MAG TPA: hypothetical protein DIV86_01495 [Alphaproteobacteria bacterium]|nr:hypothetical protein [Alphaproteobacteria bacterium]